jgi:outer membrane protein assembly factor BamD (BamD/ComL family)
VLLLAPPLRADVADAGRQASLAAQQRYDAARRLMQQGKLDAAADAFHAVADTADAPTPLRAQALLAAGLMQENNRRYEDAADTYRTLRQRFPETESARRASATLDALEYGGASRGIEFRRRQDAAWDELFPAQAEAARGDWTRARPKLLAAIRHLEEILRDFRDHPKARDIAIALGNAHMLLQDFVNAQNSYADAIAIIGEQTPASGAEAGGESLLLDAQERFAEAVRAWRRVWITRAAWALLLTIGMIVVLLGPWRTLDRAYVALGVRLLGATLLASAAAAGASYIVRTYVDSQSPLEDRTAALLVALPGLAAVIIALGLMRGLRTKVRWSDARIATVAAVISAVAALAIAAIIVNAFALFPLLDSDL